MKTQRIFFVVNLVALMLMLFTQTSSALNTAGTCPTISINYITIQLQNSQGQYLPYWDSAASQVMSQPTPAAQPGAYIPISFNINFNMQCYGLLGSCSTPTTNTRWEICGTGIGSAFSITEDSAPPCYADLVDCNTGAGIGTAEISYEQVGYGSTEYLSGSLALYTTGLEDPGYNQPSGPGYPNTHQICVSQVSVTPWYYSQLSSSYCSTQTPSIPSINTQINNANPPAANYIVTNAVLPNDLPLPDGQPLSLLVYPQQAVQGEAVTALLSGDGKLPVFLEFVNPSNTLNTPSSSLIQFPTYCIYGGVPSSLVSGGLSTLPTCTSYGPTTTQCVAGYSPNPQYGIGAYDSVSTAISTTDLPPGTYKLCGYEGNLQSVDTQDNPNQNPWPTYFTSAEFTVSCPPDGCGVNALPSGPPASLNYIQAVVCNFYYAVNGLLLILALTVIIIGGALYGGASVLPGQSKGVARSYGMGLIIAGVCSVLLALLAIWALSYAANVPVSNILSNNFCTVYAPSPTVPSLQ